MYIRDLKRMKADIENKEKLLENLTKSIREDKRALKDVCHHPEQYQKIKKRYYEATYNDEAETETTPYCSICGMEGASTSTFHGF